MVFRVSAMICVERSVDEAMVMQSQTEEVLI